MLALTIDFHIVRTRADDLDQRRFLIQSSAKLVEIGDFLARSQTHPAFVGCQLTEDQLDQRGLAGAIGTDQTDLVTAHDACRKIAYHPALTKALADTMELGDHASGLLATRHLQVDTTQLLTPRDTLAPQGLQAQHAPLVARAPRFHTLAYPDLLLSEKLVKTRLLLSLGRQFLCLALLIGGV